MLLRVTVWGCSFTTCTDPTCRSFPCLGCRAGLTSIGSAATKLTQLQDHLGWRQQQRRFRRLRSFLRTSTSRMPTLGRFWRTAVTIHFPRLRTRLTTSAGARLLRKRRLTNRGSSAFLLGGRFRSTKFDNSRPSVRNTRRLLPPPRFRTQTTDLQCRSSYCRIRPTLAGRRSHTTVPLRFGLCTPAGT